MNERINEWRHAGIIAGVSAVVNVIVNAGVNAVVNVVVNAGVNVGVNAGVNVGVNAGVNVGVNAGVNSLPHPKQPDDLFGWKDTSTTRDYNRTTSGEMRHLARNETKTDDS